MNHILAGALMMLFGVVFSFGAATAVQYWHMAHRPPAETGPVIDQALLRPAFDYRKRGLKGEAPTPWPEPVNASSIRRYPD